ncbi:MAG: alpha-1,4-glucan--maltose-1-phosphate maltosyltransferase [Candidatus Dormibacteraeota bacterium]|nr:alpha-1,4-glucan--maltose-1-phosphate maltosyltransferase [Candidatus Dormibacteraeota bacterium]
MPSDGRRRVSIEGITPQIDCGRFPIKRTLGERVRVEVDLFTDGHDRPAGVVRHRPGDEPWREIPLTPLTNDRWAAEFTVDRLGPWSYSVEGWIDRFGTWSADLEKRLDAGQDVGVDLRIGAQIVRDAASRADGGARVRLEGFAQELDAGRRPQVAFDPDLRTLALAHADRSHATHAPLELKLIVDRPLALCAAWYELFPRSASPDPRRSGTLRDVEARLPYIAGLGFDIVYLPPIHPIGRSFRKGPNNSLLVGPNDPGSPWAIGASEGGHCAIHPELGTLEDYRHLLHAAKEHGLEIALDLAYNASPDHPWVKEHPNWFRSRPDGTIQYAENPPKKYQDIYPFEFETDDWQELWHGLKEVVEFWLAQGVRIFRVDNPHTKAFPFWEWMIGEVRAEHPDVLFLAEAFTRPRVMERLAKLGFDESYTYFAWRHTAADLREYLTELTRTNLVEYYRPSFWTNTQDILTATLQEGGLQASAYRFLLAATLSPNYGIFGPTFEFAEVTPLEVGREEYLHSEKYEIRHWPLDQEPPLGPLIRSVNRIRREHPALRQLRNIRFLTTDNEQLLCYVKWSDDRKDVILTCVNMDARWPQSGWVEVPVDLPDGQGYPVEDVLGGETYLWTAGNWSYIALDPQRGPGHILRLPRPLHPE